MMYLSRLLAALPEDLVVDSSSEWRPVTTVPSQVAARAKLKNFIDRLRAICAEPYRRTPNAIDLKVGQVQLLLIELGNFTRGGGGIYSKANLSPPYVVKAVAPFQKVLDFLAAERAYALVNPERETVATTTVTAATTTGFDWQSWLKPPKLYYLGGGVALLLVLMKK